MFLIQFGHRCKETCTDKDIYTQTHSLNQHIAIVTIIQRSQPRPTTLLFCHCAPHCGKMEDEGGSNCPTSTTHTITASSSMFFNLGVGTPRYLEFNWGHLKFQVIPTLEPKPNKMGLSVFLGDKMCKSAPLGAKTQAKVASLGPKLAYSFLNSCLLKCLCMPLVLKFSEWVLKTS